MAVFFVLQLTGKHVLFAVISKKRICGWAIGRSRNGEIIGKGDGRGDKGKIDGLTLEREESDILKMQLSFPNIFIFVSILVVII